MEAVGTDSARTIMLRAAVAQVPRDELKAALTRSSDPTFRTPTAVGNALNALGRHRDPAAVVDRPQYRAALPYLAASIADECLARTIEVLGDHSDDPTRPQLLEALDEVRISFPDTTVAVMLAHVAESAMPSSTLCFEILDTDPRFGLTGRASIETTEPTAAATDASDRGASDEQREARRTKREKAAAERRKNAEVARRADEQVRRARKEERSRSRPPADRAPAAPPAHDNPTPRPARRATLTPAEEAEFDRDDPWVSAVVFAWVPFDSIDPSEPDDGKERPSVVVAGSPTHLLVRPGYSEGGGKSRDWKTVALRHWQQAGFARPTWIDVHSVRTPRPEAGAPIGWLTPEDWNALW